MPRKRKMEIAETGQQHYVAVDGKSTNKGSTDSPWDLQHALSGAGTLIGPGDTVWVTEGIYRSEAGYNVTVSGTLGHPITFKSCPGVILDGAIPEFTSLNNNAWVEDDIAMRGHHVFRSVEQKFDTPAFTFYGGFIKIGCDLYSLAQHKSYFYLLSPIHEWLDPETTPTPRFLGPGIAEDNGYLYIRLDNSTDQAQLGRPVPQIKDPDPRQHEIFLSRSDRNGFRILGSHLVIEDFTEINNFGDCFNMSTANQTDITIRNCGGRPILFGARCGSVDGLTFDGCKFYAHMPGHTWWVSYIDIKGSATSAAEPPADHVRKAGLDLGVASHVTVVNCRFEEFFDGILASAKYKGQDDRKTLQAVAHDIEVSQTTFQHIWDDAWQMIAPLYQINFHHNYCFGAGPSVDGAGAALPNPQPGTVYIHHNVIDTTTHQIFWGRQGSAGLGMHESIPLSSHAGDPKTAKYTCPRKFYYNTIVTGLTHNRHHPYVGWSLLGSNQDGLTSQATHEVYNNIFLVLDGRPGGRDFDATSRKEIYDGNVYWHYWECSPSAIKSPWHLLQIINKARKKEILNLADKVITLEDLHNLLANINWPAYYSPGWEHVGLMDDPRLNSDYKPQNPACQIGAVNLTARGWPDTERYEAWRGAVAP